MILRLLATAALSVCLLSAGDAAERLQAAANVVTEVMATSDRAIPQELLDRSECVVLVPSLKRGAFIVGGKYGRGFLSCRRAAGAGWSAPGAIRIEGGSIGLQIGGAETDVILLVLNRRGAERLLSSRFTLGGDIVVAAGPVGRSSTAQTDVTMRAEILSYSRSRGVFAGVSLQGATLRPDAGPNQELYGRQITNREIVTGNVAAPEAAQALLAALNRYSSRK